MRPSKKSRLCKFCSNPEEFGKPLFRCISCFRSYHAHCHLPHPKDKLNWICQRCLNHDSRSSQIHPASSFSFGVAAAGSRPPEDSSSAMARFAPSLTGSSPRALQCSFPNPDCVEPAVPGHVFCSSHLRLFSMPVKSRKSTPSSTPGPESKQPPSTTNGAAPVPPAKNKALPEHDRDRPIVRRKTAARAGQFSQTQPSFNSSKPPANSSFVRHPSTVSASPSAPGPSTTSPPGSFEHSQNGQPPRKRPRFSPPPGSPSPERRINSVESSDALGTGRPKAIKTASRVTFLTGSPHELGSKSPAKLNSNFIRPVPRKTAPPEPPAAIIYPSKDDPENGQKPRSGAPSNNTDPERSWGGGRNGHGGGEQGRDFLEKNGVWSFYDKKVEQPNIKPSQEPEREGPVTPKRSKALNGTNGYAYHHPESETESRGEVGEPVPSWPADSSRGEPTRSLVLENGREQPGGRVFVKAPKPPLRQQPAKKRHPLDLSEFDRLMYAQEGALNPPPEVCLATSPAASSAEPKSNDSDPPPQDEPLYLDIDPRIHWPQPHTGLWLADKQAEIEARGGRKSNFGKAAQRLRQQRIANEAVALEETLPEKMASNPAWVNMLKRLKAVEEDVPTINGAGCTPSKGTAGPGRKRRAIPWRTEKQSSSLCTPAVNGVSPVVDVCDDEGVYSTE